MDGTTTTEEPQALQKQRKNQTSFRQQRKNLQALLYNNGRTSKLSNNGRTQKLFKQRKNRKAKLATEYSYCSDNICDETYDGNEYKCSEWTEIDSDGNITEIICTELEKRSSLYDGTSSAFR